MFAVALFGTGMIVISLVMIAKPDTGRDMALKYSRLPYMHPLEIVIRVCFGVVFISFADHSAFPTVIEVVGYVLVAVGVGLMLTPPSYHRRFAEWAIPAFAHIFRPAGLLSLAFGAFLVYAAL